ncbi:MAG: MoaD/ThiS family protein [Chloroflexota bacterium]|nr:MoaD/ThiS family protein [Chloroflexota bacterium]
MTVHVVVHLHAGLLRYAPAGSSGAIDTELPDGARVTDILARFSFLGAGRTIVGLNGEAASPETLVPDGARVDLLEPISGGAYDPLRPKSFTLWRYSLLR